MSMREFPQSGYTVPLKSLRAILPFARHQMFDRLIEQLEDGDIDGKEVAEFLSNSEGNPQGWLPPFSVYRGQVDDDNMKYGEYYAIFDEADLYVKAETPEHIAMKKLGINPQFSRWSMWGMPER